MYLSNMIDNEECINITIHNRIQIENRADYLEPGWLVTTQKWKHKTIIRPVVAYGGEMYSLEKKQTQKHLEYLIEILYDVFMTWLRTVSYTHLDVYKRQHTHTHTPQYIHIQ